jgi:hypothetical protein
MDIKQFYQNTAAACFHVSWISLLIAIIFFILHAGHIISGNLFVETVPFIVFSTANFIGYRIYEKRTKSVSKIYPAIGFSLLHEKELLLAFMPAPTLRLLFFKPDGTLAGEMRDKNMNWFMWMIPNSISLFLPKRYILLDASGELLGEYYIKSGLKTDIVMKNGTGEPIGMYYGKLKDSLFRLKGIIYNDGGDDWMAIHAGGLLNNFTIETIDHKKVVTFQRGWMPLEWQKRFRDANTPILSFHEQATPSEKLAVIGFCAGSLNHYSN